MKPKISTKITNSNIEKVRDLLTKSPKILTELCSGMNEEVGKRPFSPNEWSFADQIAHLLHCEAISSQSIYQALIQPQSTIVDIHPERQFGKLVQYNSLSLVELEQLFTIKRKILTAVLTHLTEEQWHHQVTIPNKRSKSVYLIARSLALHEMDHLIFSKIKLEQFGDNDG